MLSKKWVQIRFWVPANGIVMALIDSWLDIALLITYLKPLFHFIQGVIAQPNLIAQSIPRFV